MCAGSRPNGEGDMADNAVSRFADAIVLRLKGAVRVAG
jgi:hypothetical protein